MCPSPPILSMPVFLIPSMIVPLRSPISVLSRPCLHFSSMSVSLHPLHEPLSPPDPTTPCPCSHQNPCPVRVRISVPVSPHVSTFLIGSCPYFLPEPPGTPVSASSGPPKRHVEPRQWKQFLYSAPGSCGHKHTGNPLMASVLCMIMSASRKQKPGGKGTEGGWRRVGPRADGREGPGDWGLGAPRAFLSGPREPRSVFGSPWEVTVVFPGRTAGESLQGRGGPRGSLLSTLFRYPGYPREQRRVKPATPKSRTRRRRRRFSMRSSLCSLSWRSAAASLGPAHPPGEGGQGAAPRPHPHRAHRLRPRPSCPPSRPCSTPPPWPRP